MHAFPALHPFTLSTPLFLTFISCAVSMFPGDHDEQRHHHRQHVGGLDGDGVHQPGHDDYSSCSLSAEPGSSFCWDPVLQGSTSPASSRSSTLGQARRDRRWVRRSRAPPPVRASHPPLPPHAPIPYPFAAFHRPRAAIHASLALSPFAFVRAGAL